MARPRSDIRERILRAAAERFLHDGVDGASLRQIAAEAGTSVGMVSYHFSSKDDLFTAVVEDKYTRFLRDLTASFEGPAPFEVQVARLYARIGAMDDEEFRVLRMVTREVLVSSQRTPRLLARFSEGHIPVLLAAVSSAMTRGDVRGNVPAPAVMVGMMALGVLPQVLARLAAAALPEGAEIPSGEVIAAAMRDVLLRGILGNVSQTAADGSVEAQEDGGSGETRELAR